MCGIVGAVSTRNIVPILVEGLKRLEYRGYDSCGVAVHQGGGLKRARSTDPKALADAIRQTNVPVANRMSLGGPIKFNPKGQVEGNISAAIQNLKGRPTVTLPAEFAEAKVVFPSPDYKKS